MLIKIELLSLKSLFELVTDPPQQPEQGQAIPVQSQSLPVISVPQIANQPQWTGTLSSEDPLERDYRLKQKAYDDRHRRWRSNALFAVTLVGLIVVFGFCLQIINNSKASADDKKWATAIMTSIVTGGVGFVTGKAIA